MIYGNNKDDKLFANMFTKLLETNEKNIDGNLEAVFLKHV